MDLVKQNNYIYEIFCVIVSENSKLFNNTRLYWKTVFHTSILVFYAYLGMFAVSLDLTNIDDPFLNGIEKFTPCILTAWNIIFQSAFAGMALYCDMAEWLEWRNIAKVSRIRYYRDLTYTALVVPFTLFVSSMFWSIYAVDRELVFPSSMDAVIPRWFNHAVHSWILLVAAVELLLEPKAKLPEGIQVTWIATVAYAVAYHSTCYLVGRWLYRIFSIFSPTGVCLYQLFIFLISHVFYEIQWPINDYLKDKYKKANERFVH